MERIQLFKFQKLNFRFLLFASVLFFLMGAVYAINATINGFRSDFPGDWMSVIFIFQGILYLIWARDIRRKTRFFIECNEKEFKYLTAKSKSLNCIAIADMEKLKMDGIEIYIQAKGVEHLIRLEFIEWQELNRVKVLIKDLQESLTVDKQ